MDDLFANTIIVCKIPRPFVPQGDTGKGNFFLQYTAHGLECLPRYTTPGGGGIFVGKLECKTDNP